MCRYRVLTIIVQIIDGTTSSAGSRCVTICNLYLDAKQNVLVNESLVVFMCFFSFFLRNTSMNGVFTHIWYNVFLFKFI